MLVLREIDLTFGPVLESLSQVGQAAALAASRCEGLEGMFLWHLARLGVGLKWVEGRLLFSARSWLCDLAAAFGSPA